MSIVLLLLIVPSAAQTNVLNARWVLNSSMENVRLAAMLSIAQSAQKGTAATITLPNSTMANARFAERKMVGTQMANSAASATTTSTLRRAINVKDAKI